MSADQLHNPSKRTAAVRIVKLRVPNVPVTEIILNQTRVTTRRNPPGDFVHSMELAISLWHLPSQRKKRPKRRAFDFMGFIGEQVLATKTQEMESHVFSPPITLLREETIWD